MSAFIGYSQVRKERLIICQFYLRFVRILSFNNQIKFTMPEISWRHRDGPLRRAKRAILVPRTAPGQRAQSRR